ncbi:hypothetical protein [Legionella jordanis]|uniref:hypothetical protein n=1 Tax=Legionella jordanis TaxID=456 RepID=UPI0016055116|nr:hypothetical protein [Legionella jordanis]
MYTEIDLRNGVVRVLWEDIHKRVEIACPEFAKLVNKLSPGKDYPLYLLYLPYGMLKGDTQSSYLPMMDGGFCKLTDANLPKQIVNDLGYGKYTSPLEMILENEIEYFIETDHEIFPYDIASPGFIFNKSILLNRKSTRNYSPNGILKASSGSKTAFLIPSISNYSNIVKLSNSIKQKINAPKKLSEHSNVFKTIVNSEVIKSDWRVCLLYFSEKWINSISQDLAWIELKSFIMDHDRISHQFESNSTFYELFFSQTQKNNNLITSNSYITNTAIHLMKICLGEVPGYIPATDHRSLPLRELQNAFTKYYELDSHPTFMIPYKFKYEIDKTPVYYSLQHPTMPSSLIKRNDRTSANSELKFLDYILPSFIDALHFPNNMLSGTTLEEMARLVKFEYFHNVPCGSNFILNSALLR